MPHLRALKTAPQASGLVKPKMLGYDDRASTPSSTIIKSS
jgi:hypothetical protein